MENYVDAVQTYYTTSTVMLALLHLALNLQLFEYVYLHILNEHHKIVTINLLK